jgi:medium-chain acyl-[acyl-carrier-protein] hydrolase
MPIDKSFQPIFKKNTEINFLQCYPGGDLKYTDMCHLLQLVAGEHAALGGLSFSDMQPLHQAWVLQKMEVTIFSLPKWRDAILLKTYVIKMESGTSTRVIEMYREDQLLVKALSYWAVMDTQKRRGTTLALPYEHFLNHDLLNLEIDKIHEDTFESEKHETRNHIVMLSDLDILNHANNVKYLEWCLNFFDSTELAQSPIKKFEMSFIRELKEGDEVQIHRKNNRSISIFEIHRSGKKCFELNMYQ